MIFQNYRKKRSTHAWLLLLISSTIYASLPDAAFRSKYFFQDITRVEIGMEDASDLEIFEFAKINDLAIVTFDSDFADLGTVRGFPPKIIWLRTGNHTTKDLVRVMVLNVVSITNFLSSSEGGVLKIQRNHF